MDNLISALSEVYKKAIQCEICNNIDLKSPCSICRDEQRDRSVLCVVSSISDLWSIERAGFYKGIYHIIGGKLSAIDGVMPEDLDIDNLRRRVSEGGITEVIIAMSADIDGQTTMFFIKDNIRDTNVKITTLSHGMPVGGEFDYLDDGTIVAAFAERKDI